MRRPSTSILLLLAWGSTSSVSGQVPEMLASSDSVEVRRAVLGVLLSPDRRPIDGRYSGRVWLQPYRVRDEEAGTWVVQGGPTPLELESLRAIFPDLEVLPPDADPFLCPDGVEVRMPGPGCPIRDDGAIVELYPPRLEAGLVMAGGSVITSSPGQSGEFVTGLTGFEIAFEWTGVGWRFLEIRLTMVT